MEQKIPCAVYNEELWDVNDLLDPNNMYINELRLKMKEESQNNHFTCPDCGENLVLCAGPIRKPYFRHHKETECLVWGKSVNSNYLMVRSALVQIARQSFPKSKITMDKKEHKHSVDIMISNGTDCCAIKYLGNEQRIDFWKSMHEYYKYLQLDVFYILNANRFKPLEFTNFEYLISSKCGYCFSLDEDEGMFYIAKPYHNSLYDSDMCYKKGYSVDEVSLEETSSMFDDFRKSFRDKMNRIDAEIAKRKKQEQEAEKREEENRLEKKRQEEQRKAEMRVWHESNTGKVARYPLEAIHEEDTINMLSIKETWKLPKLKLANSRLGDRGKIFIIKGNEIRIAWLKKRDKKSSRQEVQKKKKNL